MPHYTDEDMTYEEFSSMLKERYEKGESTDEYSYKSYGSRIIFEYNKFTLIKSLRGKYSIMLGVIMLEQDFGSDSSEEIVIEKFKKWVIETMKVKYPEYKF